MSDEIRMTLRLPADIHAIVKSSASKNNRSMNEEIAMALSTHYNAMDELNRRIKKLEMFVEQFEQNPTTTKEPAHA